MLDFQAVWDQLITLEFWTDLVRTVTDSAGLKLIAYLILGILAWLGLKRWLQRFVYRVIRVEPMAADKFNIIVADLEGDDGHGGQSNHIRQSLEVQFAAGKKDGGIRVQRCHEVLPSNLEKAQVRGRELLKELNGTVLVFGEVGVRDQVLRLRFLTLDNDLDAALRGYQLDDVKELPKNFAADFGTVLMAVVAKGVQATRDTARRYVADVLASAVALSEHLVEHVPAAFAADLRIELLTRHADALLAIGEQTGDESKIERAVSTYRRALAERLYEWTPLKWAITQRDLGSALRQLGKKRKDAALLREAVEVLREASQRLENKDLHWAIIQNNLGNALLNLGAILDDVALYREAEAAFRSTLEIFAPHPDIWAITANNLGNALRCIGEQTGRAEFFADAIVCYRRAINAYPEDDLVHRGISTTAIAETLHFQGKRERRVDLLREAKETVLSAITLFAKARHSYYKKQAEDSLQLIGASLSELSARG